MHELAAGQDTPKSWPVGITGFGLGVIDHPGTEALAPTAAPAAGPSNTTAAPKAIAARLIRLRIVTLYSPIRGGLFESGAGDAGS
jgi:hypothetical protein